MKLSDYKTAFYEASGTASTVGRAAALAGIALIWVFRVDQSGVLRIQQGLLGPAALLAVGLALDLLQYIIGSLTWGLFLKLHESKLKDPATEDPELSHSVWLSRPIWAAFWLKLAVIGVGYGWLAVFIWRTWFSPVPTVAPTP